ncbi:MAG: EpsG family protein [Burkholderiales bacterium]|nr:EpsG family protein [Burkholderiales bacterium]
MLTYWLMFVVAAGVALARTEQGYAFASQRDSLRPWFIGWALLTLLVGYRFEVGGDWGNYLWNYFQSEQFTLAELVSEHGDPAYSVVSKISTEAGWGIYGINLICGGIFCAGLVAFCRAQPRPWLALVAAIPYLVIVVGMGYTRQAAAIGLLMFGMVQLGRDETAKFVFWIALGAAFHKSALIMLPIAILARIHNPWWTAFWVGATGIFLYFLLLAEYADTLIQNYILAEYESEGATVRVSMNAVPGVFYLFFRHHLTENSFECRLWTWIALLAVAFVPLLLFSPSSTAVDRVALYLIPIQLYVLSRLPDLFPRESRGLPIFGVVALCGLVQFVWLNFAANARSWIPYRFYPLEFWFS